MNFIVGGGHKNNIFGDSVGMLKILFVFLVNEFYSIHAPDVMTYLSRSLPRTAQLIILTNLAQCREIQFPLNCTKTKCSRPCGSIDLKI